MTAILAGLVGLLIGFSYQFWAVRRAELAEAARATAALGEALRQLAPLGEEDQAGSARLLQIWQQQCLCLVVYVTPANFRELGDKVAKVAGGSYDEGTRLSLAAKVDGLAELFWAEHNSVIFAVLKAHGDGAITRRAEKVVAGP